MRIKSGLACAAHAAAVHLLLSIASKVAQKRILFVKTVSINQRKVSFLPHAHRRQLESFILSPSKCKLFATCHIFSFAVGLFQHAFTNSRRQFGGLHLSSSYSKRRTTYHIFSLADVGGCRGVGFIWFFGSCLLPYRNFGAGTYSCFYP